MLRSVDGASTIPVCGTQPENAPRVPDDREFLQEPLPVRGHSLEFWDANAAGNGDAQAALAPRAETLVRQACVAE
jgi:hypothetical protein